MVEAGDLSSLRLAVASGKGGTGKTLFSTSLARAWSESRGPVTYVDADVEEPNGHILLQPTLSDEQEVTVPVPAMKRFSCSRCGKCAEACAFEAIVVGGRGPVIFNELCHGCGACTLACSDDVLELGPRALGVAVSGFVPALPFKSGKGIGDAGKPKPHDESALRFLGGRLNVGEPRSTPLVEALTGLSPSGSSIVDCPPGASCAVMAALRGADAVLLVTEPTPFGAHDLRVALDLCGALGLPAGVILNRADLGKRESIDALLAGRAPLLGEMPFESEIQRAGARGHHPFDASPTLRGMVFELLDAVEDWLRRACPRQYTTGHDVGGAA